MDVKDDQLGDLALMRHSAPRVLPERTKVSSDSVGFGGIASGQSMPEKGAWPFPPLPVEPIPAASSVPDPDPDPDPDRTAGVTGSHADRSDADEQVSLEHLEAEICSQAGRLASSTCEWLGLIAEFDRRKGWAQWGVRSCAHWLAWACSVAPGAAREYVREAGVLVRLPLLDGAFRKGRLSYSKVRALTRAADRVPEKMLLEQGLVHTASQLERLVRGFRRADGMGVDQQRARQARWFFDGEGMLVLTARLPADEGAIVVAALEQAQHEAIVAAASPIGDSQVEAPVQVDPVLTARITADSHSPKVHPFPLPPADPAPVPDAEEQSRVSAADAVVAVAMAALAAGPGDSSGDDRHLVVVHVDADILTGAANGAANGATGDATSDTTVEAGTSAVGGGVCRIENGPGLDRLAALRISCDAALVALIDSAVPGEQLRLGRKTRKISPALRRALRFRDGGCRFPGCHRHSYLQAHHVRHWVDGGATDLGNLVLLCRQHHMAIHDEGFTVAMVTTGSRDAGWQFHRPDGTSMPHNPHRDIAQNQPSVPMDPENIRPGWRGERFSLADSVAAFCGATTPRVSEQVPA